MEFPPFQSRQEAVIHVPLQAVWEFNQDLTNIAVYHPRVERVELISGKRERGKGVAYRCHLTDGKNPVLEGMVWAAFRGFGRVAPQAALKSLMWGLTCLPIEQVLSTMRSDQQQAALAFLQVSRSGSGFLHDIHHHCGDLSRVTAPVLVITSKYDGLVDASHATYVQRYIHRTQLFVSEAESHLMWFSAHDREIQARMRLFLQS